MLDTAVLSKDTRIHRGGSRNSVIGTFIEFKNHGDLRVQWDDKSYPSTLNGNEFHALEYVPFKLYLHPYVLQHYNLFAFQIEIPLSRLFPPSISYSEVHGFVQESKCNTHKPFFKHPSRCKRHALILPSSVAY